jgi:hypothetical protein
MDERSVLKKLVQSRKFWLSLFALIQTIVFQFLPQFPPAVWQAIDALVIVLISTIAYEDAAQASA